MLERKYKKEFSNIIVVPMITALQMESDHPIGMEEPGKLFLPSGASTLTGNNLLSYKIHIKKK